MTIVTVGWDRKLSVFEDDLSKRCIKPTTSLSAHDADIFVLVLSEDRRLAASGDEAGMICIWSVDHWTLKRKFNGGAFSSVIEVAFLSGKCI